MITFNSLVRRAKILNEANLYNNADLTSAVMSEVGNVSPEIQKWFKQKYVPWYNSPDGDSEKNTSPYSWKEGDQDWAKNKADLVTFKGLTESESNNIRDIAEYLATMPAESVTKVTYAQAVAKVTSSEYRTPSATSPKYKAKVLKYYAQIDTLLARTDTEHLSNAKEWFRTKFMYWFFEECPHFNAESGFEPTWYDKIQHTMEYIGQQNMIDETYERNLGDPAELVAEAEAESGRGAIESNIKPLTEGKDYVTINPLYNFNESEASESDIEQLTKFKSAMKNGRLKFIRLISKQSFINEGEKLQHCVKSDHYKYPKDHTLLSLWKEGNPKGDPQATMEFDNEGKDLIGKYDKAKFNIIGDEPPSVDVDKLTTMIQCKGKGNHAPTSKQIQFVLRKFVTLNKINITQDGEKIGLKKWLSNFYDPDSTQWDELMVNEIIPAQKKRFSEIKKRIIDADTGKQVYPNG